MQEFANLKKRGKTCDILLEQSGKPGVLVLEQCGKKLHKVLEQYGIKTADLVFEQGVKLWDLELELLVKYCDNELVHVQLWDFAHYSRHWDIRKCWFAICDTKEICIKLRNKIWMTCQI